MNLKLLRNYRAQIEDVLKAELAGLHGNLDRAQAECVQLAARVDQDARQYMAEAEAGISSSAAAGQYAGLEGLAAQLKLAEEDLARAQERWDDKRAAVLEAARETKKLDLLWDRQQQRQRRMQDRQEQQAVDESAARRFGRALRKPS